nr:MAG TPA: hypothetical protein [Caudoviricetes sp.]
MLLLLFDSKRKCARINRTHTHLQVSVWCDLLPDQLWQAPELLLPVQVGGLLYAIIGDRNTRIRTCSSLLRLLLPPDRGDIPKGWRFYNRLFT